MTTVILAADHTSGDSTAVSMAHELGTKQSGIVQVDGIDDETVKIQGRLEGGMGWVTIATFTSDDAQSVMIFPQMRVSMTGTGSITARIGA